MTRSSASVMVSPLLRNAISCSRRATVSKSYVVVSNTVASAQNRTVEPVFLLASPCLRVPGIGVVVVLEPLVAVAGDVDLET